MDVDELILCIQRDRKAGFTPLAVIGTAGTTANGSIDPLEPLADVCDQAQVWFHVDAAYAGALMLSAKRRRHLHGIERADSISVDPHKWMFIPFSLGALLTRHVRLLRDAFAQDTAYLGRGHTSDGDSAPSGFYEVSLEASRRFNGLKLWATLKHLGVSGLAAIIERQVELAEILCQHLSRIPDIEIAPRSPTNIVCFRLAPAGMDEAARSRVQEHLQSRLEDGAGW